MLTEAEATRAAQRQAAARTLWHYFLAMGECYREGDTKRYKDWKTVIRFYHHALNDAGISDVDITNYGISKRPATGKE